MEQQEHELISGNVFATSKASILNRAKALLGTSGEAADQEIT
jgi:hypothetical protein